MSLPTDAKERKAIPIYSGLLAYFPDALAEVARVSQIGNDQHNGPGTPLKWDRSKSTDDLDAGGRHVLDRASGLKVEKDGGRTLAKGAWRLLAALQKEIEAERAQNDCSVEGSDKL
jgi:hypothetical protein